jgi:hypothetical protein
MKHLLLLLFILVAMVNAKRRRKDDYQYHIKFIYASAIPTEILNDLIYAKTKIESILTTHFPNVIKVPFGRCGCPGISWTCSRRGVKAKDLLVYVRVAPIDGEGGTGARARVCRMGRGFSRIALIELDLADAYTVYNYNLLKDLFIHELLHTVGVGSLWLQKGLVNNFNYLGDKGNKASETYGVSPALVENQGGPGSINSHWRENTYRGEIMTSILNFFGPRPISALTIESLQDIGHRVNPTFVPDFFALNTKQERNKDINIKEEDDDDASPSEINNNWLSI